jgi:hypothetical protein
VKISRARNNISRDEAPCQPGLTLLSLGGTLLGVHSCGARANVFEGRHDAADSYSGAIANGIEICQSMAETVESTAGNPIGGQ